MFSKNIATNPVSLTKELGSRFSGSHWWPFTFTKNGFQQWLLTDGNKTPHYYSAVKYFKRKHKLHNAAEMYYLRGFYEKSDLFCVTNKSSMFSSAQNSVSPHLIFFLKNKLTRGLLDPTTTNAPSYNCNISNLPNWYWHTSSLPSLSVRQKGLDLKEVLASKTLMKSRYITNEKQLEIVATVQYKHLPCKHHHNYAQTMNCFTLRAVNQTQGIYFPMEREHLVPRCI